MLVNLVAECLVAMDTMALVNCKSTCLMKMRWTASLRPSETGSGLPAPRRQERGNNRIVAATLYVLGNLPAPELIAAETVEDLQAALDRFAAVAASLSASGAEP
jgi:hypothetical protein